MRDGLQSKQEALRAATAALINVRKIFPLRPLHTSRSLREILSVKRHE
jgi:hypothetical protein